jgi:SAM-dependent MidA family methyltransferase
MDGNFQLIAHLEDLIADHGPIPFSEYMETVLYHPEHGYYCRELNPIGSRQ